VIIEALKKQPPGRKQVGPASRTTGGTCSATSTPSARDAADGRRWPAGEPELRLPVDRARRPEGRVDLRRAVPRVRARQGRDDAGRGVVLETGTYIVRRMPTPGLVSPIRITGVLPRVRPARTPPRARQRSSGRSPSCRSTTTTWSMPATGSPASSPAGKTLRAFRQDSPGDEADLVAEVETTGPTTFVFRESWHPRWHAYLDGAPVPVRRVTPDFPRSMCRPASTSSSSGSSARGGRSSRGSRGRAACSPRGSACACIIAAGSRTRGGDLMKLAVLVLALGACAPLLLPQPRHRRRTGSRPRARFRTVAPRPSTRITTAAGCTRLQERRGLGQGVRRSGARCVARARSRGRRARADAAMTVADIGAGTGYFAVPDRARGAQGRGDSRPTSDPDQIRS